MLPCLGNGRRICSIKSVERRLVGLFTFVAIEERKLRVFENRTWC